MVVVMGVIVKMSAGMCTQTLEYPHIINFDDIPHIIN